jgi:hypothetical protein
MSRITALAALVFLPCALLAQTESHIEAAQELLSVTNARESAEQAFDQVYPLFDSMSQDYPISDEHRKSLAEDTEETMEFIKRELNWSVLEPRLVKVYVDIYSEDELRGLIEFYRSPLGQKFIEKTPEIMEANAQMTLELFRELMPKLREMQEAQRARSEHTELH